jgi:hypothetical protein
MHAIKLNSLDNNSLTAVEISQANLPAKLHADLPPP